MSFHQQIPNVAYADREIDATDAWLEVMDPENERGESCTAYLKQVQVPCYNAREGCFNDIGFELIGISVEDASGTIYRNRTWCQRVLGADFIWRFEVSEMEAA